MGQFGEFKEFQFTGSFSPLYDTTSNQPPVDSLLMVSGTTYTGNWQQLFMVTASWFVELSGSLQGPGKVGGAANPQWTFSFPTNTNLKGNFVKVRLTSGSMVIASQGKNNI
jgi:hypothetical protein